MPAQPSEPLIEWWCQQPIGELLLCTRMAASPPGVQLDFDAFAQGLPGEVVRAHEGRFCILLPVEGADREQALRHYVAGRLLDDLVWTRRLEALSSKVSHSFRGHDLDMPKDDQGLFPIACFVPELGGFRRGGTSFVLAPTTPSLNSSSWTTDAILRLLPRQVSIRVDPFMWLPVGLAMPVNRMQVYGRPMDWHRVVDLRGDEHTKFTPDAPGQAEVQFTDLVWSPRDNEVHFVAEEVPQEASRPGRYFHAILDRQSQQFVHADGALRIYNAGSLRERATSHVRKAGKVGQRVKVFAIQDRIEPDEWASLLAAFMVWNEDIARYVSPVVATRPDTHIPRP